LNVYIARLLSFDADKLVVIQNTLEDSELQRIIFPAKVYTTGDDSIIATSFEQIVEVFELKQAEKKPIVVLTLYSENGLELSFTLYFTGAALPTVVLLKFKGEHIDNGIVNLKTFSRLIEHGIESFNLDHATVYDDATIPYPQGLQYFKGPQGRRYPIQLGWLNYFGADLVNLIGYDKFEGLQGYSKRLHDSGGITLTYDQDFSHADHNTHQQMHEAQAIAQLGLNTL
jgi:hypothetical protein